VTDVLLDKLETYLAPTGRLYLVALDSNDPQEVGLSALASALNSKLAALSPEPCKLAALSPERIADGGVDEYEGVQVQGGHEAHGRHRATHDPQGVARRRVRPRRMARPLE